MNTSSKKIEKGTVCAWYFKPDYHGNNDIHLLTKLQGFNSSLRIEAVPFQVFVVWCELTLSLNKICHITRQSILDEKQEVSLRGLDAHLIIWVHSEIPQEEIPNL